MKGEGNHTRNQEEEHGQQLQIGSEDGTATALLLVLTRENTLDDILVGTPVPETDNSRTDQGTKPRILRVAVRTHQVNHSAGGTLVVGLHVAELKHLVPAAQGFHSQHQDNQRAEEQDWSLKHRGVEHALHTSEDSVYSGDEHKTDSGNPEEVDTPELLYTEYLLEHKSAGIDGNGHLRQHIADQRDNAEDGAALCVVAALQELRHRIYHTACVERYEYPSENQNHPSLNLPVGHCHT